MNDIAEIVRDASGDRDWRGLDWDQAFARPELTDDALTAAVWATAKFHRTFPGWQLYRRITAGMTLFDDELDAWVVGAARLLARARKRNGRCYVEKRGAWVGEAARDALGVVIHGAQNYSVALEARTYGVEPRTWLKIYKPVLAALTIGLETFRSQLHEEYRRVKIHTPENAVNLTWEGPQLARHFDVQSGNVCTRHAPNPDYL